MAKLLTGKELVQQAKLGANSFPKYHIKGDVSLDLSEIPPSVRELNFRDTEFSGSLTITGGSLDRLCLSRAKIASAIDVSGASIANIDDDGLMVGNSVSSLGVSSGREIEATEVALA